MDHRVRLYLYPQKIERSLCPGLSGNLLSPSDGGGSLLVPIRFAEDAGGMVMTVHDPELVLTARSRREAKR